MVVTSQLLHLCENRSFWARPQLEPDGAQIGHCANWDDPYTVGQLRRISKRKSTGKSNLIFSYIFSILSYVNCILSDLHASHRRWITGGMWQGPIPLRRSLQNAMEDIHLRIMPTHLNMMGSSNSLRITYLVGGWALPLWKYESQWEGLSHILWKIKMFQTTNQIFICIYQPNMEFLEFRIRFFSQYHRKFASFTRHHFCSRAGNSPHAHTCWPFGSRAAATPRRSAGVRGIQLRRYRLKNAETTWWSWHGWSWHGWSWPGPLE